MKYLDKITLALRIAALLVVAVYSLWAIFSPSTLSQSGIVILGITGLVEIATSLEIHIKEKEEE